jgi:membrane-associated PAP2 superfamily phosphatase
VFLAFPGLDIWFSDGFYESGNGFLVSRLPAFVALRDFHRNLTAVIIIVLVVVLIIKVLLPQRPSLIRPRDIAFILGTVAIGSGVIVNLIFKDNWGRPRPFRVEPFGGDQPFVGAWKITDYCASNCSFVSGEASSAMWLLTLAVLLPPRWRASGVRALLVLAVALSLNRIAMGAHFLSDVLLSWWMTLLVMAVLYRLLYVTPPAALADDRLEDGLTRFGTGLRDAARAVRAKVTRRDDAG